MEKKDFKNEKLFLEGLDVRGPVDFVNTKYNFSLTELTQIDPAYLFVYSANLYEDNKKDDALFWFYVAQYRAKIIGTMENKNSIIGEKLYKTIAADADVPVIGKVVVVGNGISREYLYNYIHSGLGPIINCYAGSNIDNWISQMQKVLAFEKENPFDPFKAVPIGQLDASKLNEAKERAEGLAGLIDYIQTNKAEFEKHSNKM